MPPVGIARFLARRPFLALRNSADARARENLKEERVDGHKDARDRHVRATSLSDPRRLPPQAPDAVLPRLCEFRRPPHERAVTVQFGVQVGARTYEEKEHGDPAREVEDGRLFGVGGGGVWGVRAE